MKTHGKTLGKPNWNQWPPHLILDSQQWLKLMVNSPGEIPRHHPDLWSCFQQFIEAARKSISKHHQIPWKKRKHTKHPWKISPNTTVNGLPQRVPYPISSAFAFFHILHILPCTSQTLKVEVVIFCFTAAPDHHSRLLWLLWLENCGCFSHVNTWCTLWETNMAMENHYVHRQISYKGAISYGYVGLPEGSITGFFVEGKIWSGFSMGFCQQKAEAVL